MARSTATLFVLAATAIAMMPANAQAPGAWLTTKTVGDGSLTETSLSLAPNGTGYAYSHYFASGGGEFHKTTDFGRTWSPMRRPPFKRFAFDAVVQMATPQLGYAADASGVMLRSHDGARTWDQMAPELREALDADYFRDIGLAAGGRIALVGGTALDRRFPGEDRTGDGLADRPATIFITRDGGDSWDLVQFPFANGGYVQEIEMLDESFGVAILTEWKYQPDGWLFSHLDHVMVTRDGGRTWSETLTCNHGDQQDYGPCLSVGIASPQRFVIGRTDGVTLLTDDGGKSYRPGQRLVNPLDPNGALSEETHFFWIHAIEFLDEKVGYASTKGGGTYRTDDGGSTWRLEFSSELLFGTGDGDIAIADSARAIAGGPNFLISRIGDAQISGGER